MPQITLDMGDAAELAEMLTFLASWLSGSQKQILADSFAAFVGHPRLQHRCPARRPAPVRLPPRRQRRRRTLRRASAVIANVGAARSLDRITRITPNRNP
jgi:hypothetical protein